MPGSSVCGNTGPSGDIDRWRDSLATDLQALLAGGCEPPTLIGWSLGGLVSALRCGKRSGRHASTGCRARPVRAPRPAR